MNKSIGGDFGAIVLAGGNMEAFTSLWVNNSLMQKRRQNLWEEN